MPSDYQSIQFVDFYVTWNPSLLFDLKSTDSIDEFIIAYRSIDELTDSIEIGKKNGLNKKEQYLQIWCRQANCCDKWKYIMQIPFFESINESISCKYLQMCYWVQFQLILTRQTTPLFF